MNIWITGSKGQLGTEIMRNKTVLSDAGFIFTDVEELDLIQKKQVLEFVRKEKPDWIINCAAYTAVDKAEEDKESAFALNRDIPANLTEATKEFQTRLIHVSTDFVFDGTADTPYTEDIAPHPVSVYGESKYAGEQEVLQNDQHFIVRTSWLYSPHGNNFVKTMLRLGRERDKLGVVSDQVGTPTSAADLARALLEIVRVASAKPETQGGIYHYSNEGSCSWYDFASEIMRLAGLPCKIEAIPSSAYPAPARRPAYSVMDLTRIRRDFGLQIPEWKESLARVIEELLRDND